MFKPGDRIRRHPDSPAESREVDVIAGRVVELETLHVGESVWVASGRVSQLLPSGPRLQSPIEVTATGDTEAAAMTSLRRRIEDLAKNGIA